MREIEIGDEKKKYMNVQNVDSRFTGDYWFSLEYQCVQFAKNI